jgi:inner membrane protease ATP23
MSTPEQAPDGAPPSQAAKSTPPQKIDPVYYTWSNTFSILMGRMTGNRNTELEKGYFSEQDIINEESYCKRCETNRDYLLQYSPIVRFMKDEVTKLGGDINDKNMICRVCTNEQSGGFSLDHGILLCANKFRNRGHQEDTMAHEMVHAWDHLKWKVEADNLRHQACLEVCERPSSFISGVLLRSNG